MPSQTQKSPLLGKLAGRLNKALAESAAAPIEYGPMRLPPGIANGVAQIVECGFKVYDQATKQRTADGKSAAGQCYFRAAAVVIEPTSVVVNGQVVPVRGQQTSIMEGIIDTKTKDGKVTTMEEHVVNVQNELKKMLGDSYTPDSVDGAEALEATAAAIKDAKPYIRFSTSLGKASKEYPDPRTFENWNGAKGLEDYVPPESDGVVDNTAPSANGEVPHAGKPDADAGDATAEIDLAALVEAANGTGDDAVVARKQLTDMAVAAGVDSDAVENAANWHEVADMIGTAESPAEDAPEDIPEEPIAPVKDTVVYYKLRDAKGNPVRGKDKKEAKAIECNVQSVNAKAQTVTLKNLETEKLVLGADKKPLAVKWDDLEKE